MYYTRIARKLRIKIGEFSGELSRGLPKVAVRFLAEMIYGIQASQSVVLTKIARVLEEGVSVKKTEERLSRQLRRDKLGERVGRNILKKASTLIGKDTLLILDLSDLRKRYAQKMEYLTDVWDGSEGEVNKGYWLCKVIGTEVTGEGIVPLVSRLFSTEAPDHVSENVEILEVMEMVSSKAGGRGIWVMDRGGDRKNLIAPMLKKGYRFVIRLRGDRHLIHAGSSVPASKLANDCACPYAETVVKIADGKEKAYQIEFGFRKVRFPGREEPLGLLVVKGFGQQPMMLLTTEPLRKNRKVLWRLIQSYIRRWSIEETIRFIKQSYDLEDVRVLGYRSLQNLMPLVTASSYFAAVMLDTKNKLRVMAGYVLKAAKRVFGIPDFHYYAIADGLRSIFTRHPGRLVSPSNDNAMLPQGSLFASGP